MTAQYHSVAVRTFLNRAPQHHGQFESRTLGSGVTLQPSTHTVRAGLAYKFGVN